MKAKKFISQGNDLIEGSYSMTIDELRLLNLALSKIDSVSGKPDKPYRITSSEFGSTYGIQNPYSRLRQATRQMLRKPVTMYVWSEKQQRLEGIERPWFEEIRYTVEGDNQYIIVEFSNKISDQIYDLKRCFTQINFKELVGLESSFSVRLYCWLVRSKVDSNCNSVVFGVDWMLKRSGITAKYTRFSDVRRRVIDPAVSDINRNTSLSVVSNPVRCGRKISAIEFIFLDEKEAATGVLAKPKRKRLLNRPHVAKGSHKEGEWAKKNINIIRQSFSELELSGYPLDLRDMRKLIDYFNIIGDKTEATRWQIEVDARSRKTKK